MGTVDLSRFWNLSFILNHCLIFLTCFLHSPIKKSIRVTQGPVLLLLLTTCFSWCISHDCFFSKLMSWLNSVTSFRRPSLAALAKSCCFLSYNLSVPDSLVLCLLSTPSLSFQSRTCNVCLQISHYLSVWILVHIQLEPHIFLVKSVVTALPCIGILCYHRAWISGWLDDLRWYGMITSSDFTENTLYQSLRHTKSIVIFIGTCLSFAWPVMNDLVGSVWAPGSPILHVLTLSSDNFSVFWVGFPVNASDCSLPWVSQMKCLCI